MKRGHGPLYILLVFLTASLLFREIHLDYTGKAIYVCLAVALIWGYRWRERLKPQLEKGPTFPWLTATLFTYFISQAIARRFFRIIPGEELLHVPLEEAAETAGHLMQENGTWMEPCRGRCDSSGLVWFVLSIGSLPPGRYLRSHHDRRWVC